METVKPLLLLILDGWGTTADSKFNAITQAKTPQWDDWLNQYPHCLLDASGEAVGLPKGQIGNSEVGHMHIAAGRVIWQDFSQINQDISNGLFLEHSILQKLCQDTLKKDVTLHVMGLLSSGGIHSHEQHLYEFLKLAASHGAPKIVIHLFLDGRDSPPHAAKQSIQQLEKILKAYPFAKIGSLCGRFYAMDRDHRWERVQEAYDLLTIGNKPKFPSADAAMDNYPDIKSDEFMPACVIGSEASIIEDYDNIFFYNFRSDRAIQLTECFVNQDFDGFKRSSQPIVNQFVTMTQYSHHLNTTSVYPPRTIPNTLGEIVEQHHYPQLRIAETEKFPHVTYFLNGGKEEPFAGESRVLISSAKVKTYDLMPQMRAHEITKAIIEGLASQQYPLIIANFANADMVGHCGELPAAIEAIEALDHCFQEIDAALKKYDGQAIITADHGNAEVMFDEKTQQPHTAHTLSKVPFLFIGKNCQLSTKHGSLIDIAPTVLELMHIIKPLEMTGESLITKKKA